MDIERLADACGGLAWISERLFEIEGRMASPGHGGGGPYSHGVKRDHFHDLALDRFKVVLARSSRQLGQHAQWWRASLPDSPALDAPSRIRPPSDSWVRLLDFAESADTLDAVAAVLGGALTELASLVDEIAAELSPISDGPVIRIARIVSADLAEQQEDVSWAFGRVPSLMFQAMGYSSRAAYEAWTGELDTEDEAD